MKALVAIPAYNEASVIASTLKSIKSKLNIPCSCQLLVINDGSTDSTAAVSKDIDVAVISHPINRGLGGALGTAFSYARNKKFDLLFTIDADGQHDPNDLNKLYQAHISTKADVLIGSRTLTNWADFPTDRKLITFLSNLYTKVLFGVSSTDSQSGLRLFNRKAINTIDIKTNQMEVSSEIFAEIKANHLKLHELPIANIYTQYSRAKGQSNLNAIAVSIKLLYRLFRS